MDPPAQRKLSRATSKRNQLRALASRGKPGLALDTSYSQYEGLPPRQICPYESKTRELGFASIAEVKAQRKPKKSVREQLENGLPVRPSQYRSLSDSSAGGNGDAATGSAIHHNQTAAAAQQRVGAPSLLHKRIESLRPSPLGLAADISPSDRVITIGIAAPSDVLSEHTVTPQSPQEIQQHAAPASEVQRPTKVITPVKEYFELSHTPEDLRPHGGYRPASSIYSRYTNGTPKYPPKGETPPLPPLPLFVGSLIAPRESTRTVFEGDALQWKPPHNALSVYTTFEEDEVSHLQQSAAKRLTSQSNLAAARRSRGWWNVITSPFSAGSLRSNIHFWRSPPLVEDAEDSQRMLHDASSIGTVDGHAGLIFTNRAADDNELRTAVPSDTGSGRPPLPERSDTAPGALDASAFAVNIYRIPSRGLAAAYYDPEKHFASLILRKGDLEATRDSLYGLSPSHSVMHSEDDRDLSSAGPGVAAVKGAMVAGATPAVSEMAQVHDAEGSDTATGLSGDDESPFTNSVDQEIAAGNPAPAQRNTFSTPSGDELKGTSPRRPTNERNNTAATQLSYFSPLSATPTVEHAHVVTFKDPRSANPHQLREVELTPTYPPDPPGRGLATTTMASREADPATFDRLKGGIMVEKPKRLQLHIRTDSESSWGLGIKDGEKKLYPAPRAFVQKQHRLGIDRSGQVTVRSVDDDRPKAPWYRRYFWLLASVAAGLLALLLVLLIVLIPQHHDDMAVQAEWLNLTGFPALPTGVATVVEPNTAKQVSGCVSPHSLWTCNVPPSAHGASTQPKFRFEIRFHNGTVPGNQTQLAKRSGIFASASTLVRRDIWSDLLYAADPAVPSKDDQEFLGQHADSVTSPYEGEKTPFYISLLNASALSAETIGLEKRQNNPYPYPSLANSTSTSNASSTAAQAIPKPALLSNGKPADPQLYPYAESQPLRLFNRGQRDEHYGFYAYFDHSLFVSNISASTSPSDGGLSDSIEANVALGNASAVCTFSQTRLHIQVWTRKPAVSGLDYAIPLKGLRAANSTANDMTAPGSFPYAVTLSLDRHGGQLKKKGVYCYGLDEEKHVVEDVKMWVAEDRSFGGESVNPADPPGGNGAPARRGNEGEAYGGIDGGSGGCACQWRNWN